jgi:alpha-tubulin suppressor-like RCC1 family protein
MSIIEQIQADIDTYIANLDANTSADEMMLIVAAINNSSTDRVVKLDTVDDLPEAYNIPKGSIFFVKEINTLVYSLTDRWLGIDGRVLRLDPITALAWGNGGNGRLGDDTVIDRSSPVTVVGGITNWSSLSAGLRYSLGIAGGIAYAWGSNNHGQLGDNTILSKRSPVTVVGGITNWSQVSGGNYHSLGIANGIAYAWGQNFGTGRLGDDTVINKSSPVTVVGGITDWSQISAGGFHSLGVTDTGIAYAWGNNNLGKLGDDTVINKSSPVTVVGGITNWSQVIGGDAHSLGIAGGVAYACGSNNNGCLGIGIAVGSRSSPVTVVGGITNWSQVSGGYRHSLGIANGIAYAWGNNTNGRLGDNTTVTRSSPVTVVGGITNWTQLSAGTYHSLGIANGVIYGWGNNISGSLGDGTIDIRSSPVTVVGGITSWSQVSTGQEFSLALKTD